MADDSMNIFLVVLFATIGADIGALVNYYLARWLGRPIIYKFANSRLGHMCLIDEEKIHHAEEYFRKHGAASTFFGRLIPAVRQLISIPAGLAGMKIGPFLLYTTLGAAIWNSILALLGYLIYRFTDLKTTNDVYVMATEYSHEIGYVIIAVVVIVIVFLAYKGLKKKISSKILIKATEDAENTKQEHRVTGASIIVNRLLPVKFLLLCVFYVLCGLFFVVDKS